MKVLFQALYTLFSADTNFKNAVGSQFYPRIDQENAAYPYAAYFLVNDTSDWTFSEDIELITIQISIFSDKNSAGEVWDAFTHQMALFDDAILSVTGYTHVRMHRQNHRLLPDEYNGTWHLSTDYEIELQRERS